MALHDKVVVRVTTGPGKTEELEVKVTTPGGVITVDQRPDGFWEVVERGRTGIERDRLVVNPMALLSMRTVLRR
jgi:hypothetical protein